MNARNQFGRRTASVLLAVVICTSGVLVAAATAASATVRAQASKSYSLTVAVDSTTPTPIPNGEIQLGVNTGYFAAHGLHVTMLSFASDTQSTQALVSGETDIANVDTATALELVGENLVKVKAINSTGLAPDYVLIAKSSITSLKDLEGQTYAGSSEGSQPNFLMDYLLAKSKVPATAVGVVNVGSPSARALAVVNGKAAATIISTAQWESLSSQQQTGLHLLINEGQFLKAVPFQAKVDVATVSDIKAKSAALQLWTDLCLKLARYYHDHAKQFASGVIGLRPDLTYNAIESVASQGGFVAQWCVNGCLDTKKLQVSENLLFASGSLPTNTADITVKQWVDTTYVKAALKQYGIWHGLTSDTVS